MAAGFTWRVFQLNSSTRAAEEALVDASIAKAAKGEPDLPPEFEMDKYDEEGMFGGGGWVCFIFCQ